MFVDECFAHLHFFWVHRIGFSYLRDDGFFQIYPVIRWSLRREFSLSWFIKDLGISSVLQGELLFDLFGSLCQGHRESEFSDVRVVLS